MSAALDTLPRIFQNWQENPSTQDGISFAASVEDIPAGAQVWKLDLPAGDEESQQFLEQAASELHAADLAVRQLPAWFDKLVQEFPTDGENRTVAFSGPSGEPAVDELLRWMSAFEPTSLSFGAPGLTSAEVSSSAAGLQGFLDKLSQQVLHLAWVETRQEGRMLARSVIAWNGDAITGWSDLTPGQVQLHKKNIHLALSSRIAMLNMVITVISGAGKLGVLLAAPGGALLALPAAWRLANQYISKAGINPTTQE